MNPSECLAVIGWTQREFARRVERPQPTVHRWFDGSARMPEEIRAWLEELARAHQSVPTPQLGKTRKAA